MICTNLPGTTSLKDSAFNSLNDGAHIIVYIPPQNSFLYIAQPFNIHHNTFLLLIQLF
jgi:hypothetical protein